MTNIPRYMVAIVSLTVVAVVWISLSIPFIKAARNYYEDYVSTQPPVLPNFIEEIVIVEVRESTLANLPYRSPFDRELLAKIVDKLIASKVQSIGIDILLDQKTEPQKDALLRQSLLSGEDRVYIASAGLADGLTEAQFAYQADYLRDLNKASVVLANDPVDGIVRHTFFSTNTDIPPLPLAMARVAATNTPRDYFRIRYLSTEDGKSAAFTTYPADAVLVLPGTWFENKHVLIGMNIENIDHFRTPFTNTFGEAAGLMPGVHIHAHTLNQILAGSHVITSGPFATIGILIIGAFAGSLIAMIKTPIWLRGLFCGLAVALSLWLGAVAFEKLSWIAPSFGAALSLLFAMLSMSAILWQRDRKQKLFIRNAWSKYVNTNVVEQLVSSPDRLKLGGERRTASFIFTDVAGFTSLSEDMDPDHLSQIINQYLDVITEEFLTAGATVDKIVGDAVFGFFGAPIPDDDHANKAIDLSFRLQHASKKFQERMKQDGIEFGNTRIGVSTGTAIVGNFGGQRFFDYSAFGDVVNTASRLEGANKSIGTDICVCDNTRMRADRHIFRPVGMLKLAGKEIAIKAWEPMKPTKTSKLERDAYMEAYTLLASSKNRSALDAFEVLDQKWPNDPLVAFHLERLNQNQNGVEVELKK